MRPHVRVLAFVLWLAPASCGWSHDPDAAQSWDGYVGSFTFRSGSDRIRIELDPSTGAATRSGVVIFGEGTPPGPVTDPTVGYPTDFSDGGSDPYVAEGFAYRFDGATVSESRVQITVALSQLWSDWCAMQPPTLLMPGSEEYACVPNGGVSRSASGCTYGDPFTGTQVPIDCNRLTLCSECTCAASGCRANDAPNVAFDLDVSGAEATGTLTMTGTRNVYLTR